MVNQVVSLLIRSVFLALPAIAIYLQIISNTRTRLLADNTRINTANEWPEYHLVRASVLCLSSSALFGLFHISITRAPIRLSQYQSLLSHILGVFIFLQVVALGVALFLFVLGIFVSGPQLDESEQSIWGAIRTIM